MKDNYNALKQALKEKCSKNSTPVKNLNELEKNFQELVSKFTIPSDSKELKKMLNEKLINQYEEMKDGVTFATLIEKEQEKYLVYYIIFDTDFTYSNLLLKEYNSLLDAENYFNNLKSKIINNDINNLSTYILNNL